MSANFWTCSILLYLILQLQPSTASCFPPGVDMYVECNHCWCLADGISVCTKMDCKSIPTRFWRLLRIDPRVKEEKLRAFRNESVKASLNLQETGNRRINTIPTKKNLIGQVHKWFRHVINVYTK